MGIININDIDAGWAALHIGNCEFYVSYLSDLKAELDDLLIELEKDPDSSRRIILEGEGHGDLSLVAYLTFDDVNYYLSTANQRNESNRYDYVLNIIWQDIYSSNDSISIIKYPYDEFMEEYRRLTSEIKEEYITHFLCPQSKEEYLQAKKSY